MKSQLVLLRWLLRAVLFAKNFEQLSNAVVSARKWRSELSRSDQLILLREVNKKINSYVYEWLFEAVKPNQGVLRLKIQFEDLPLTIWTVVEGLTFFIEGSLVIVWWLACQSGFWRKEAAYKHEKSEEYFLFTRTVHNIYQRSLWELRIHLTIDSHKTNLKLIPI